MKTPLALFLWIHLYLWINPIPTQNSVLNRFTLPKGYHRVDCPKGSFGEWLENLPLKPEGSHTWTYTGHLSDLDGYTAGVIDLSLDTKGLQQCADAVIRMRSEYLFSKKDYSAIAFHFTNGLLCKYLEYAKGYRFIHSQWIPKEKSDFSKSAYEKYNLLIFTYAGTLSLNKELKKVDASNEIKAGDVFIKPGSPGHCFQILEVIENPMHQKKFLIAQSFIPAQDIQILQINGNPWFSMEEKNALPYGDLINFKYLKKFD